MFHLVLVSGLLTGLPSWGACGPHETSLNEEQPLEESVVTLNESCRERVLQQVGSATLRLLRLDRPPSITADPTRQVHEAWAKEAMDLLALSSVEQPFNLSSNQTLVTRRESCTQISHHVTMDDLGWQSWVLHPESFVFTQCLGCRCHPKDKDPPLPHWLQECGLVRPSRQPDVGAKQRHCCQPRRIPLPFVFFREDGSLIVRAIRLERDCNCRP
ncbi:uncharacterized protein LOC133374750 [Rhineura floridana]|uniref:uncharacterized protein LOC133374750 n=1 Tax=Rhineura floridana TaxID=261503 RepID=UPI002AC7EFE8|nr:uncharacterized protein LOC133374750 [Rhineura floridana]